MCHNAYTDCPHALHLQHRYGRAFLQCKHLSIFLVEKEPSKKHFETASLRRGWWHFDAATAGAIFFNES